MKKIFYVGVLTALLLAACGNDENESTSIQETPEETSVETPEETEEVVETDVTDETTETPVTEELTWNESIEEIISAGGSQTEKADAVEMLARDYVPTEEDLNTFSDEIINEFKAGEYLINLNDETYTLSNLFKSVVVERNTEEPMKSFAFDFYQNTKYNYRGVDTILSESTISNEEQMNKALTEMGK